jgi:hypothetical protein
MIAGRAVDRATLAITETHEAGAETSQNGDMDSDRSAVRGAKG